MSRQSVLSHVAFPRTPHDSSTKACESVKSTFVVPGEA